MQMATIMGGASSHGGSSSETELSAPENIQESSNSPLRSPDTTTMEETMAVGEPGLQPVVGGFILQPVAGGHVWQPVGGGPVLQPGGGPALQPVGGGPFLHLVEPPIESFSYRYPTEMKGTHGSILGISTLKKENSRKRIYPCVKLCNYTPLKQDEKVFIRCSLTTADEDENNRILHVHQLKGKGKTTASQFKTVEIDEPFDIVVTYPNYQAVFGNLTIVNIKKEDRLKEVIKKKKRYILKRLVNPHQIPEGFLDEKQILREAEIDVQSMNVNKLNTACLKFEAFRKNDGLLEYQRLCPAIYSKPIKNNRNAQFSDLRICRIDKVTGTCLGKDEIFIFVEKVNKKDIKVRFYELDDNGEEVWEEYAEFSDEDVHYQFAIAFRTPRYKDVEINGNVKVYFQLERPSSGSRSTPREFEYTPDPKRWQESIRKRPRLESPPIPVTMQEPSCPSSGRPSSVSSMSNPPGSSSSSSAMIGGLESFSTNCDDESLSWISEILGFDDYLGLGDIGDVDMEPEPPAHPPSLKNLFNEKIANCRPEESQRLFQVFNSKEAMDKLASCYGVSANAMDHISNQIRTGVASDDAQNTRFNDLGFDGAVFQMYDPQRCKNANPEAQFDFIVPQMQKNAGRNSNTIIAMAQGDSGLPEMEPARSYGGGIAHHQGPRDDETFMSQMSHHIRKPYTTIVHKGLSNQVHLQNRNQLTRDNIVSYVDKGVTLLLKNEMSRKIKEKDMKRILLQIFAKGVGEEDDRVLHILASNENFSPEVLKFLNILKMYDIAEIIVNLKNNIGQTPLHVAAEKGSLQTISLLVDNGADVNAQDINLNTAIHLVANRTQSDAFHAIGHILEKGPDLSIYNIDGLTVLHLFVLKRKVDVISSLVLKHENVALPVDEVINQHDRKQGNTPLHLAVQKRFREIVSLLLNFDERIDVNLKNFEGKTPLAYVFGETDREALEIEELLLANNADLSLVSPRRDKKSEKFKEPKDEVENNSEEETEDVDESLPSYAQEWKSDCELNLMDAKTICSVCPVLDEGENWLKLAEKFNFDEEIRQVLRYKWSASLYLLKAIAETMPNVTPEVLRDTLIKINSDCKRAAQFIDDMILCNMGVF